MSRYNRENVNSYSKFYEELKERQAYKANLYKKPVPHASNNAKIVQNVEKQAQMEKAEQTANEEEFDNKEHQGEFKEALSLYKKGLDGDSEAVKKSYEIFKKLNSLYPEDALCEGYLGCVTSLLGRDDFNPTNRMKLAMKGLKILDKAVGKKPDSMELRNLRGYVCHRLPEMFFHRTATAVEDFTYLISKFEKDNSSMSLTHYCEILFDLGAAFKELGKMDEAQNTWDKLLSKTSERKYYDLVKQAGGQVKEDSKAAEKLEANTAEIDSSSSQISQVEKKNLEEGFKLHKLAQAGNKADAKTAYEFFEEAYKAEPENPVAAAYYADCISLLAKDALDTSILFSNAIRAIKLFDGAVSARPDDINIRLLRAKQSYRLPEVFFKRAATAIGDFELILKAYYANNSVLSKDDYVEILYMLGKSYQRLDMAVESQTVWDRLLNEGSDTIYYEKVSQELKNLSAVEYKFDIDSSSDTEKLFKEGIRLHNLAAAGVEDAAVKARDVLKRVYDKHKDNPLVEAYYGSGIALEGKYAKDSQDMFGNTIQGMKLLNNAVSADIFNPKLRYMRGNLFFNLPEAFFHAGEKAAKDFRFVISSYEQNEKFLSDEQYWQLLYDMGCCYERMNETEKALKIWRKLINKSKNPKYKDLLGNKLEDKSVKQEDKQGILH